jgi:hypothetical protein
MGTQFPIDDVWVFFLKIWLRLHFSSPKKAFAQFTRFFFCHHSVRIRQKKEKNLFGFIYKLRRRRRDIVKIMSCIGVWPASWGITLTLKREDYLHLLLKKVGTNRTYFNIFSCSVQEWILPMTSSLLLDAVMPMEKMLLMSCSSL